MRRPALLLLASAPTLGFTDCEDFSTVTVPATDTVAPALYTKVLMDGTTTLQVSPEVYVDSPDEVFWIVPALIDAGGADDLWFDEYVRAGCDSRHSGQQEVYAPAIPGQYTWQSGHTGSTVSTGMYLIGQVTSLAAYTNLCPVGDTLQFVQYEWYLYGRDFAGNDVRDDGTVTWVP